MSHYIDHTHDPKLRSWLASAQSVATDFPIQNLPHGVFRRVDTDEAWRGGVAIGDQVLDVQAALTRGLFDTDIVNVARLAGAAPLNGIWVILIPASRASSSVPRCGLVALPADP